MSYLNQQLRDKLLRNAAVKGDLEEVTRLRDQGTRIDGPAGVGNLSSRRAAIAST